jgi:hypothetical protein
MVAEPALNTLLAEYLASGLARAVRIPETRVRILKGRGGTGQPDIRIVDVLGVRILVEGKIGNLKQAINDCKKRIDDGLADVCFAVSYDKKLAGIEDVSDIREEIEATEIELCLVKPPTQLTLEGWPDEAILKLGTIKPSQLLEILGSQSIYDEIVGTESAERIADTVGGILEAVKQLPKESLKSAHDRLDRILQIASGMEGSEDVQERS